MPNFTKLFGTVAVIGCLGTAVLAEDAKPAVRTDLSPDTVVAKVNDQEITLGMMQTVRDGLPAQYQSLPDQTLFDGILDQLIQQTALSEIGEGMKTHRDEIALEVDKRAYYAGQLLNYTAERAVSDEALKKAYDDKYAKAEPSKEYHAAHILVPTEDEAKAIKAEIDGGKDFAEEAKAKSQDGAAANGGDLGWFALDQMVKPFADAVAGMKDGEVAGPIQTEYGWHIIKLEGTRLAKAPTLDEAREELSGDLRQKAVEDRVTETVAKAKVEKMTDGIDPTILKDDKVFGAK
ncbi:MAG: peptidylprolyl isomerase [Paenirhodobacter sp.]|uniref:peptidylprolyl isomerase n=1 Tax=Paenirhodobacter sp. TaxID=1965326 RepID=UPI003D1002A4